MVESGLVKATDFLIAAPLSDPPLPASPPADGPAAAGFEAEEYKEKNSYIQYKSTIVQKLN